MEWKGKLIPNHREIYSSDPLATFIQQKQMIIIISDRSRNNLKSGGAWITANTKGNSIIEGTNPNFGIIKRMHSNRAEIFGILSALTFLKKTVYIIPNRIQLPRQILL